MVSSMSEQGDSERKANIAGVAADNGNYAEVKSEANVAIKASSKADYDERKKKGRRSAIEYLSKWRDVFEMKMEGTTYPTPTQTPHTERERREGGESERIGEVSPNSSNRSSSSQSFENISFTDVVATEQTEEMITNHVDGVGDGVTVTPDSGDSIELQTPMSSVSSHSQSNSATSSGSTSSTSHSTPNRSRSHTHSQDADEENTSIEENDNTFSTPAPTIYRSCPTDSKQVASSETEREREREKERDKVFSMDKMDSRSDHIEQSLEEYAYVTDASNSSIIGDSSFSQNYSNFKYKELRKTCKQKSIVFKKIPAMRISWANRKVVESILDFDDVFLRLVFCISDVCILKWEMSCPEIFHLKSTPLKIEANGNHMATLINDEKHLRWLLFVCYVTEQLERCTGEFNSLMASECDSVLALTEVIIPEDEDKNIRVEIMSECEVRECEEEDADGCETDEVKEDYEKGGYQHVLLMQAENNLIENEDFTMALISSDSDDFSSLPTRCTEHLPPNNIEKSRLHTESYTPMLPETKVANSDIECDVNLKEVENFCADFKAIETSEELVRMVVERNACVTNGLFENEETLESENATTAADTKSHPSQLMYSSQSTCLDLLETDQNLGHLPEEKEKSALVWPKVDNLDNLDNGCEDSELVYTDDGRVCMGENSSFSIMYTHKSFQFVHPDNEPIEELPHSVMQLPDRCSRDGDHVISNHEAQQKATILKIQFQQSLSLGQVLKPITNTNTKMTTKETCQPITVDNLHHVQSKHGQEDTKIKEGKDFDTDANTTTTNKSQQDTQAALDSPNRSFCFTSTPAQSSNISSCIKPCKTSSSKIPQLKSKLPVKCGDKGKGGYPPRVATAKGSSVGIGPGSCGATNKLVATPRSAASKNNGPSKLQTPLPKLNLKDCRIPRPSIPSGGDSSRSTVNIPSANSRVASRMSEFSVTSATTSVASTSLKKRPTPLAIPATPKLTNVSRSPLTYGSNNSSYRPSAPSAGRIVSKTSPKTSNTTTSKPPSGSVDDSLVHCAAVIRAKLKGNKESQEELSKLFNEVLNSSHSFRDSSLSSMQLAKVLTKFEPTVNEFSLRDRQKLASKLMNAEPRIDFKSFVVLNAK